MSTPFDIEPGAPPLIAILRGLAPEQAAEVGALLYRAGFRILEVPLNRPHALRTIELLAGSVPAGTLVGGGTVLTSQDVDAVAAAGGRLIVSPDSNAEVIRKTRQQGLWSLPGAATPTEAFAAMRAGAHAVKAFPAESLPAAVIKAWRSVLPAGIGIYPVGGITPEAILSYRLQHTGVDGFGLGSALFVPGMAMEELDRRARRFVAAWSEPCA